MIALLRPLAVVAVLAVFATPAMADDSCRDLPVTAIQAIETAAGAGLVRVREVECDDGEWEIEGWNAAGRKMEVEIDARTGRITDVDYD